MEEMVQRVAPSDGVGGPGSGVDLERERTYRLAERLNGRLDELNRDLTDVIDEINAVSTMLSRSKGGDDPVSLPFNFHFNKIVCFVGGRY